jgi:hypothetical protein
MRDLLSLHGPTRAKTKEHWDERDGGARLAHDKALIAVSYPDLKYGINARTEEIFLYGAMTLISKSGIPTRIETRVIFPDNYPHEEPKAYDISNRFFPHELDRHFWSDERCCLWFPLESEWDSEDSNALINFLHQLALFFMRQLIYEADPRKGWAWGQRSHGIWGFLEYIQDKLGVPQNLVDNFAPLLTGDSVIQSREPCPCNSRLRYKACHASIVHQLMENISREMLRRIFKEKMEAVQK